MREQLSGVVLSGTVGVIFQMKLFATVALILLLAVSPALAQLPTGTILGVVKDSTGGTMPDAQVTLTQLETGSVRTTTTGSDGEYRVVALQPGHYSVKIEKSGFKTLTQSGITLDVAAEIDVNASLEIGSSTQEVTVTGEAPLVETTTSSLGGLINDDKMAELPLNGRNFVDLALMTPGITNDTNFENTQARRAGHRTESCSAAMERQFVRIRLRSMARTWRTATGRPQAALAQRSASMGLRSTGSSPARLARSTDSKWAVKW